MEQSTIRLERYVDPNQLDLLSHVRRRTDPERPPHPLRTVTVYRRCEVERGVHLRDLPTHGTGEVL